MLTGFEGKSLLLLVLVGAAVAVSVAVASLFIINAYCGCIPCYKRLHQNKLWFIKLFFVSQEKFKQRNELYIKNAHTYKTWRVFIFVYFFFSHSIRKVESCLRCVFFQSNISFLPLFSLPWQQRAYGAFCLYMQYSHYMWYIYGMNVLFVSNHSMMLRIVFRAKDR